jgi:hypothetical protein
MSGQQILKLFFGCTLAIILVTLPVFAQQNAGMHPAKDSPELYLSFFFFLEDFQKWTGARVSAEPVRKDQIVNSSAKHLGISPSEFSGVEAVTSKVTAQLRALNDEAHSYVQSKKGKGDVDYKALAAYNARRNALIQSGIEQIKNSLSAGSWQSLSSYVNNEHRQQITVNPPKS